jgi:hypothetical protein
LAFCKTSWVFLLLEATPTRIPRAFSSRMKLTLEGKTWAPFSLRTAWKETFLRLPRPQTVSSSGGSSGVPYSSVMPREARKSFTPL